MLLYGPVLLGCFEWKISKNTVVNFLFNETARLHSTAYCHAKNFFSDTFLKVLRKERMFKIFKNLKIWKIIHYYIKIKKFEIFKTFPKVTGLQSRIFDFNKQTP